MEIEDQPDTQPVNDDAKTGDILITLQTRDGLHIRKGGLTYSGLKLLVERLEGLC